MNIDYAFNEALQCQQTGELDRAKDLYLKLLQGYPQHAESLHNLGIIFAQSRNFEQAVNYFKAATEANPGNSHYFCNLATALNDLGQAEKSIEYFEKARQLNPQAPDIYYNLGNALLKIAKFDQAVECYKKTIELNPNWFEAYLNCGNAYDLAGNPEKALEWYEAIIKINPYYSAAYINKGNILNKLNRQDEALQAYDIAQKLGLSNYDSYLVSAEIFLKRAEYKKSIEICNNAVRINPYDARAYYFLGMNFFHIRDLNSSIENFKKTIDLKPDYADAYNGIALCYSKALHPKEAQENFAKALELNPDFFIARINSADAYYAAGDIVSALAQFQKLDLQYQPLGLMQFFKQRLADWTDYQKDYDIFIASLDRPRFLGAMEDPWHIQRVTDSPELAMRVAQNFCKNSQMPDFLNTDFKNRPKNKKIKIGYFSADFREHAVTHLTLEMFGLRDTTKFETYAFGFGRQNASPELRARIEKSFDHYIDINPVNDIDAVKLARELNIDIAVDLSGITSEARPQIFTNRAAPIQINYLGFTSTLGTQCHDYVIGDPTVIPVESRQYYTEKVVHLPCVMPFDTTHNLSPFKTTRSEAGLPPEGFIFCSFNQHFKINPETYDVWMSILKRVPGSYLWISQPYEPEAIPNLKKEAAKRGVDPERIIFANRIRVVEQHLARIALADLFLDTFPYNAHTSAIDTLWTGVPIVTRMGRSFASRLAGSLLKSVGLDKLITNDYKEYEELVVDLALNPEKLKKYRKLLEKNKSTHRLFNTKLYTQNYEKALTLMYDNYLAGKSPDHIVIE
jgi:protein O-GlcNAc transferase